MSDNKKPDCGHSGSNGEDDGNRFLEEILMSLQWLIFIAATAGFLAFQLITNAIYEKQYGGDVAWISKQSRQMFPIDEEDEDIKDEGMEDEDEEELKNQMEAEEVRAENEMLMEEGAGALCLTDLATCNCE